MRVITGTARGRRLLEPEGMDTRPTTDRVKEGIFSSIQFEIEGRRVLDLFGGTGQMGIEALSRGAAHCTFLDLRKEAVGVIRENLKRTGFAEDAAVVQGDYLAFLIVSENGIIVCENGSSADWPAVKAPYRLQKDYRYGKIRTALYRRETE